MMKRRSFTTALLGIGLGLPLAACSSRSSGGLGSQSTDSGLLPAAEGKTSYPLTLTCPYGTSELEQRPSRIASVSYSHDEEFLSLLGATPVLTLEGVKTDVWMQRAFPQEIEATIPAAAAEELDFEGIAKAKPDIILATGLDLGNTYEKLSAIAPVVGAPEDTGLKATWEERMRSVAQALDLADAGETAITKVGEDFAALRSQYPRFQDKTINYVVYYDAANGLHLQNGTGDTTAEFFSSLGFAPSPLADEANSEDAMSNEQIGRLEADLLLVSDNSYDVTTGSSRLTDLTDLPLYQNLAVVKEGRTATISNTTDGYIYEGEEHDGNLAWAVARTDRSGRPRGPGRPRESRGQRRTCRLHRPAPGPVPAGAGVRPRRASTGRYPAAQPHGGLQHALPVADLARFRLPRRLRDLGDRVEPARAAHAPGRDSRGGVRRRRRPHPGHHPQPAGRHRHPGRQRGGALRRHHRGRTLRDRR